VRANPHLLGGTDRFDTVLLQETDGAVHREGRRRRRALGAVPAIGIGLALKVEDGALRAQHIAVLSALQQLGVLPAELPPRLAEFAQPKSVRNTRGERVGDPRRRGASHRPALNRMSPDARRTTS
jgi:L-asparaginase II